MGNSHSYRMRVTNCQNVPQYKGASICFIQEDEKLEQKLDGAGF